MNGLIVLSAAVAVIRKHYGDTLEEFAEVLQPSTNSNDRDRTVPPAFREKHEPGLMRVIRKGPPG